MRDPREIADEPASAEAREVAGEPAVIRPDPGSPEAVEQGCTCPVIDNYHGQGVPWRRKDGLDTVENPSFWITEGCPLHDGGDSAASRPRSSNSNRWT